MKKITALVLVLIMCLACVNIAFAADPYVSPSKDDQYEIHTVVVNGIGGSIIVNPPIVNKGNTTIITAKPDENYEFDGWIFNGEFEWISGDMNSPVIEIRPLSDLTVNGKFKGTGGANKDTEKTSPTTGYNATVAVVAVSVAVLLSGAAVVYTGKKYFEAR